MNCWATRLAFARISYFVAVWGLTWQGPLPHAGVAAVQLPSTDDLDGSLGLPKATYRLVSGVGFTTAPTRKEKRLSSTSRRLPTVLIWPSCAEPPVVL